MNKILSLSFFVFISTYSYYQTKEPLKVTDMLKIRSISGVDLSNDGSKAVFTVTAIEPDGDSKWESKYVNSVWMVNTDGNSSPKQLTQKEGSHLPRTNERVNFGKIKEVIAPPNLI